MAWKDFYFVGDGMYPEISQNVQSREDWEKIIRVYKGDLERLRKMEPELNHKSYGGPGRQGDDIFSGSPTLGELIDSMED